MRMRRAKDVSLPVLLCVPGQPQLQGGLQMLTKQKSEESGKAALWWATVEGDWIFLDCLNMFFGQAPHSHKSRFGGQLWFRGWDIPGWFDYLSVVLHVLVMHLG
eukprot:TRINITY_DN14231_c0_g1_i1.p3 TRINITY_DN14231_c0_g1~~TRINITY_DN14231_c0_g1_i1.p3  ORF type:complete len:104 (+),score=22.55 TRINITY_DN14231_c0_g1_i1:209-520(+)